MDQIAHWSDLTGFALVVDSNIDLNQPVSPEAAHQSGRELRDLQIFLARFGMFAQALEPEVYRIRRDGPGLSMTIHGQGTDPAALDLSPAQDSAVRIFRPRLLPGTPLERVAQSSADRRLRTLPNLYTVGEVISLRGVTRGQDEGEFSLIENGLPVTPERLSSPLQLSSQANWLSAVSGPDSALRGPNALGGWIELGNDEELREGGAIEARVGNRERALLRGLWVPWVRTQRGQFSVSGYVGTQSSTVVQTPAGRLPRPSDAGVEVHLDWEDPDRGVETRTHLLVDKRDFGYPLLLLGPSQPDDAALRESQLIYDGSIGSRALGLSHALSYRHNDSVRSRLELGWLESTREEYSQIDLLDSDDANEREFRWSRLAFSTEFEHDNGHLTKLGVQHLPRRLRRELRTGLIPGGSLFALPMGIENAGEGRINVENLQRESLNSSLITLEEQLALSTRWRLGLRAGWAIEEIDSAMTDAIRTDDDCNLRDRQSQETFACAELYPDSLLDRAGKRTSDLTLPAISVEYYGDFAEQLVGWRRGYGRSRSAIDLTEGIYRVFAPERIDAIEYSILDAKAARHWRIDMFAYHWRDRRSYRRQPGDLDSVLIEVGDGGRALATGIEMTTQRAGRHWSLAASAGWLHARYISGEFGGLPLSGRRLEDAPRYTANMMANWRGDRGWFADLSLQFAGSTFLDATNQRDAERPSMRLIDLSFGRRIGALDVFAYAANVSDDASFQSVIPRSGLGGLGSSYRIVEGLSVGVGIRWRAFAD